jgi:uncharacterized protein (DUF2225 family)
VRTKAREKDFHATFHGENPTYYGVICCNACGYAQFENDFKKPVSEKWKTAIGEKITANWKSQDFSGARDTQTAIKVHLIALLNYKVLETSQTVFGKLYLRLVWFYRELGSEPDSKRYTELALEAYIESYENEHLSDEPERELEITYLIGELNRQLGHYKEAVRWFGMTVHHEYAYKNRLLKMYAKEQWALASEQYKAEKTSEH